MSNFDLVKDLRIGHIVEVSGTSIRVELDGDVTDTEVFDQIEV